MESPVAAAFCTVVFVGLAGYAAIGLVRARRGDDMVAQGCHLLMAVAMAFMLWPLWSLVPVVPATGVFAAMTVWFGVHALRAHTGDGRLAHAAHAVMSAAMVWMVVAMADMPIEGGHQHGGPLTLVTVVGLVVTVALLIVGAVLAVDALAAFREHPDRIRDAGTDMVAGALMCLGMVAMAWPMSIG